MRLLLTALIVFLSFACQAEEKSIYISYPEEKPTYQKIAQSIENKIRTSFTNTHILNLSGPTKKTPKENDLIISIGNNASIAKSLHSYGATVLHTFTTKSNLTLNKDHFTERGLDAVVIDQPLQKMVNIAEKTIRNDYKNTIIIIISEKNTSAKEEIKQLKISQKAKLEIITINEDTPIVKTIDQYLFNAASIIAVHDNSVWSGKNARWILHQAYTYKVPVIGYSKAFLKAGAMISIYSSADQIIKETERRVTEWISTGNFEKKITSPNYQIEANRNIAKALQFRPSSIANIARREK